MIGDTDAMKMIGLFGQASAIDIIPVDGGGGGSHGDHTDNTASHGDHTDNT